VRLIVSANVLTHAVRWSLFAKNGGRPRHRVEVRLGRQATGKRIHGPAAAEHLSVGGRFAA
jgi:hypothetical protein